MPVHAPSFKDPFDIDKANVSVADNKVLRGLDIGRSNVKLGLEGVYSGARLVSVAAGNSGKHANERGQPCGASGAGYSRRWHTSMNFSMSSNSLIDTVPSRSTSAIRASLKRFVSLYRRLLSLIARTERRRASQVPLIRLSSI